MEFQVRYPKNGVFRGGNYQSLHDSEVSMITLQERGKMYVSHDCFCIDEFVDHINGHLKSSLVYTSNDI